MLDSLLMESPIELARKMSKIDLQQLIKILNLTQSDADNEALTAIRMVNSRLKAAGMSWESLINPPKKQYRWKEMPDSYDGGFFNSVAECKDFTRLLVQDQVDWMNKLIRFKNKHHYLPQEAWNDLRTLWQSFRENY